MLKLLICHGNLEEKELSYIWVNCQKDGPSMVDLIANLEHIAGILNPKDISLFLKFISAKIINDAPAVKPYELDLVLSLANMNTKTEDADQM